MEDWSFDTIPDQQGRIALITGANSGLGFQTALMLTQKGAEIIMACRNIEKTDEAIRKIENQVPGAKISPVQLDLANLESVAQCAKEVRERYSHIDLLINNAGVMVPPFSKTRQGFELQFGTNHLGHFALTGQLLPLIVNQPNSRIISISSIAAKMGYIDFDDLNFEHKKYRRWPAYSQSKLANQIFMKELEIRLANTHSPSISVAAHPGVSSTDLFKTSGFFMKKIALSMISHTPDLAALSILRAACDPQAQNGSYWGPSGFGAFTGTPEKAKLMPQALDTTLTQKLWEISEKLTGTIYPL